MFWWRIPSFDKHFAHAAVSWANKHCSSLLPIALLAPPSRCTVLRGGLVQQGGDAAVLRAAITEPAGVDTAGVDANTQFLLDLLDNKGEAATLHAVCTHQSGDCLGGILADSWTVGGLCRLSESCH
jgi:hypothetical protein